MSNLTNEDILKLAHLARIKINADEVEHFTKEITEILHYVEQLGSVDLDGLEPTSQVSGLVNVMRPDEVMDYGITPKELLKNAPATEGDLVKVKRMIK